jgi:hypothetical protein
LRLISLKSLFDNSTATNSNQDKAATTRKADAYATTNFFLQNLVFNKCNNQFKSAQSDKAAPPFVQHTHFMTKLYFINWFITKKELFAAEIYNKKKKMHGR